MKQKRFSEEQIIKLLQDAKKSEKPIEELCREAGCSTASFYTWKAKYGDATVIEARRAASWPERTRLSKPSRFVSSNVTTSVS